MATSEQGEGEEDEEEEEGAAKESVEEEKDATAAAAAPLQEAIAMLKNAQCRKLRYLKGSEKKRGDEDDTLC